MEGVAVDNFITYEDYLDSQITALDRRYLADDDLARQLVRDTFCFFTKDFTKFFRSILKSFFEIFHTFEIVDMFIHL